MAAASRSTSLLGPSLALAAGATCISLAPVFVKAIGMETLGPTAIGFWRTILGALLFFGLAALLGHPLRLTGRVIGLALLAGFVFFLDLFFWHRSIFFAGAGTATILANTQVFWAALIAAVVFRQRLAPLYLVAVVVAFVGVVLLIGIVSDIELSRLYIRGVAFGAMTGIVYSVYITSIKLATHRPEFTNLFSLMAWSLLVTATFLGIAAAIEGYPILPPDRRTWILLGVMAAIPQVLGWYAITSSLPRLPIATSGLLLLLQPFLATIWGIVIFNEQLTGLQVVGATLTLAGIYVGMISSQESGKKGDS